MPRTPRPDYTNTYHHVVVRGVDGLPIFQSSQAKQTYLDLLQDVRSTHDISLYAFGFLSNHLHQLVRRNNQKMGHFYRRVNGRFAQWYNVIHDRSGSLYDGRYYSSLIEKDEYLLSAMQYIHHQGVDAGLYETPTDDPWNTASLYTNQDERFDWIDWKEAKTELIDQVEDNNQGYAEASDTVDEWLNDGLPTERIRDQVFLASDDFIEKYMQIRKENVREEHREESPVTWDSLMKLAQDGSELDREKLTEPSKRRDRSEWRSGLAYAGRRYGHMSLSEIADKLNVSSSGVSRMIKRVKDEKTKIKDWWDEQLLE